MYQNSRNLEKIADHLLKKAGKKLYKDKKVIHWEWEKEIPADFSKWWYLNGSRRIWKTIGDKEKRCKQLLVKISNILRKNKRKILTDRQYQILILRYFSKKAYTLKEIAKHLKIDISVVYRHLKRAESNLRKYLKKKGISLKNRQKIH